ncbi:MAG TPA: GTP 3',8-cyclase MoaA [Firmicutes bacterium]|nr:GTP 3',8-cyclase MoaA [Bacillota bacterium]
MIQSKLRDSFGRRHNYLRVSVTDRCNLRCAYCMGPEGVEWLPREQILSYEEIVKVVKVAVALGIDRVRLTGGEPLTRKDLSLLISELSRIRGIQDLSMTTNGLLLPEQAQSLRRAGLQRVNISLDSLNPATYRRVTGGGDLQQALAGIEAALEAGLNPVKINVVLLRGVNDHEVPDFIRLATEKELQIRFIEYMPVGVGKMEQAESFFPVSAALEAAAAYELSPTEKVIGTGPAKMYKLAGGAGAVGFIPSISEDFCAGCNRLRLTADGFLKPCLFWQDELAVRPVLYDPDQLRALFFQAMIVKKKAHQMGEDGQSVKERCMSRIGG